MSVTSINQCRNLKALILYCVTPKKKQEKERVAKMYCDLGDYEQFLKYSSDTINAHKRKVQGFSILQSFPQHEFDVENEEHIAYANEMGRKLSYMLFPNSPCIVITHADSEGKCVHNHIIVLNHDLGTNGAIRSNRHYRYVKQANDSLMERFGLEVCVPKEQQKTQGEYWSNRRNGWFDDLLASVDKALAHSCSIEEFQECLLAEGVSPTLYKANGDLKERFTYKVMDSDGKEHKKRSDKLGEQYSREAIERTLLENKRKRDRKQQPPILSMSDWILLQQSKKQTPVIQQETTEPIQEPVISIMQPVNKATIKESEQIPEKEKDMEKEKMEQELASLQKKREAEYEELIKERQRIHIELEKYKKKLESDDYADEDFAKRDSLDKRLSVINMKLEKLKELPVTNVKLNESLMPKQSSFIKDKGMSL